MAGDNDGGKDHFRGFPYVSNLRIFEPLEAFSDEDQLTFTEQRYRNRADVDAAEAKSSLSRIARTVADPFPHRSTNDVRVLHYPSAEGITSTFYCPSQLSVRSTLAAETLIENMKGPLANILLPEAAREAHQSRLDPDELADSIDKVHTRAATWGVPFSWFALIHEDDHSEVVEEHGRVLTVRISAPLTQAVERAAEASTNLVAAAPELDLLADLSELSTWMENFHDNSIIELDYGAVANVVFPDESPYDVRQGIEALAEGDMTGAAAAYRRLASRWIPVRQLGRAS
ncbi:hypothetical protein [Arthrobacter monumenti]